MGFRIIILAAMGLGALYMMHLLAQDYDRIRRPITKAIERALRGKRDVDGNDVGGNVTVDWAKVLDRDQFGCLQSMICQLMSGAQRQDSEAIMFVRFLNGTYSSAPPAIISAYNRGMAFEEGVERCFEEYPFCWFSAKTMLRILRWFT